MTPVFQLLWLQLLWLPVDPAGLHPITSRPMERAVPAIVLTADSSESQLRSGIFSFAISSTCFAVTVPTFVLFGSADPLAMFAARFSSTGAGGVFVMKV